MRTVFVLFDSLNRHLLGPYGGTRIPTPAFDRLAQRATRFDKHYVGSLPCMPARRDMMTGRLGFLHRSWGPIEPFDDTVPDRLRAAGVHSHLATDHHHYWEDGGATYHTRYSTHDFVRGQEGDPWKAEVQPDGQKRRKMYHVSQFSEGPADYRAQNMANRTVIRQDSDFPSAQVFDAGLDFIARNQGAQDWMLQIETFDPHEPFHAPPRYREGFPTDYDGPVLDWPRYGRVEELPEECDELRANYYATVAHCDALLGRLLDTFDAEGLWDDTALIVTTDHGFLLGEHDFWAKNRMTMYEEIVHIPLFVWTPHIGDRAARVVDELTQTTDIAGTILDLHGVDQGPAMQCQSVLPLMEGAGSTREAALFGYFGGAVNVTDGRMSYHRYPADIATQEIYQYTLMPTHIWDFFHDDELRAAELAGPLSFTRGMPVLRTPVSARSAMYDSYGPGSLLENQTRLYDLQADPQQRQPLDDPKAEAKMAALMTRLMKETDAPPEAFRRLDLD